MDDDKLLRRLRARHPLSPTRDTIDLAADRIEALLSDVSPRYSLPAPKEVMAEIEAAIKAADSWPGGTTPARYAELIYDRLGRNYRIVTTEAT